MDMTPARSGGSSVARAGEAVTAAAGGRPSSLLLIAKWGGVLTHAGRAQVRLGAGGTSLGRAKCAVEDGCTFALAEQARAALSGDLP
jgi:hypothetical protein